MTFLSKQNLKNGSQDDDDEDKWDIFIVEKFWTQQVGMP